MSELRFGLVKDVDLEHGRVRVTFSDRDDIRSFWLHVLHQRTRPDQYWWMPEPGEHVACLVDEHGEDGVVMGAIYGRDKPPESSADVFVIKWANGGYIRHDRASGELEIYAPTKIRIDSACVLINGSPAARIGDGTSDGASIVTGACSGGG